MGHNRESTLAIDKTNESYPIKLQQLWDAGIFVRVDEGPTVTVLAKSNEQLAEAGRIVADDGPANTEHVTITADDVGTVEASGSVGDPPPADAVGAP